MPIELYATDLISMGVLTLCLCYVIYICGHLRGVQHACKEIKGRLK